VSETSPGIKVHVFELGEAYDDLHAAFFIDESTYTDVEHARSVVESAEAAMSRTGVIFGVEVTSGDSVRSLHGLPTWEDFKQRHFVDGVPLPVRPRPDHFAVPPSWADMNAEMVRANDELREHLLQVLTSAFPDARTFVTSDKGPLRVSAGSIHLSEETFGFVLDISTFVDQDDLDAAFLHATNSLAQAGWTVDVDPAGPGMLSCQAERGPYWLWVRAKQGSVSVRAYSPIYNAPAAPNAHWTAAPRPRKS
jgi:hypothetical protein